MAELNFKTKAQNLKNLQTKLKKAKILPLVLTSLEELILNEEKILSDIQALKANKLIIRSSSLSEDSMKTPMRELFFPWQILMRILKMNY